MKQHVSCVFPVWFPTESSVSLDSGTNINSFTTCSLVLPALSWCCWIMSGCNKNTRVNRKSLCLTLCRYVSGNKNIWLSSLLKYIYLIIHHSFVCSRRKRICGRYNQSVRLHAGSWRRTVLRTLPQTFSFLQAGAVEANATARSVIFKSWLKALHFVPVWMHQNSWRSNDPHNSAAEESAPCLIGQRC